MKMVITVDHLAIIPENPQDAAYIEHVLGIKQGSPGLARYIKVEGAPVHALAYVEIQREAS